MGHGDLVVRLIALWALAFAATAQGEPAYRPTVGQPGKDVIWVPTPAHVVDHMLRRVELGPKDLLVDLGSGDGRIVIAAAKSGARATGVEYNLEMVALARRNAEEAGVAERARFVHGDLFETDFRHATVVSMYLLPSLAQRLRPVLLAMRPGTRIVSYEFNMAEWEPDEIVEVYGSHNLYFWVVPARVDGVWKLRAGDEGYQLAFDQTFQRISGSVELGGKMRLTLREPRLRGDRIWFTLVDEQGVRRDFSGRVTGARMSGAMKPQNGAALPFTASRS
jgi:SAM-dependent methyltransferase